MHKVFISYHHKNDQRYKDKLVTIGRHFSVFLDRSVDEGDIPDNLTDEQIRREIRDRFLRDSTVTIVLVGKETKGRKHVDWEIHSSMYNGSVNKRSGIVVINLPEVSEHINAPHGDEEKRLLYPEVHAWTTVRQREEYERRYPYMPSRIIDNLLVPDVTISVVPWNRINVRSLQFLIEAAFRNRKNCPYDLSKPMRRANSPLRATQLTQRFGSNPFNQFSESVLRQSNVLGNSWR